MDIKYYYIDDDSTSIIGETAKGLNTNKLGLHIEPYQPKEWKKELDFILNSLEGINGLIFDWDLSKKSEDGVVADFNVGALAQQIRHEIIEKGKRDIPIVLCSAQAGFKNRYQKEKTIHDLFDQVYEKEEFSQRNEQVISELVDLAEGYQSLHNDDSHHSILGINKDEEIDYRILDTIRDLNPHHEIAGYVLNRLILSQGILIDKHILFSRLGVDEKDNQSLKDQEKLLEKISGFKYKGIFSEAWPRWWAESLLDWWEENLGSSLTSHNAVERVEQLNQKWELNLKPASPTEKSKSDYFWTVCKHSKAPLAIEDGILASNTVNKPMWQEEEYYSIEAALENIDSKDIHPLEEDRVNKLKKQFTRKRPKK